MDFDKVIMKRYSARKFKSRKPNWRKIMEAIDVANQIPLSGNIPTLRFVFVDKPDVIDKLAEACQQDFVAQASYVVVICSDTAQVQQSYDERGLKYSRQQAGAAIESFLLKVVDMGLTSCWVGAFSDVTVRRILKIPDDVEVEAILPVGYEMGKPIRKRRKPSLDSALFFNKYGEKHMRPVEEPEAL